MSYLTGQEQEVAARAAIHAEAEFLAVQKQLVFQANDYIGKLLSRVIKTTVAELLPCYP